MSANDFLGKVMVFNKPKHNNSMYIYLLVCVSLQYLFIYLYFILCTHIVINLEVSFEMQIKIFSDCKDFSTVTL